jgi:hypothetical protein
MGRPALARGLTRAARAAQVARSEWVAFVRDCETFYINFTPEGADQARCPRALTLLSQAVAVALPTLIGPTLIST